MQPLIEIRNLGKQYKLTATRSPVSFREAINASVKNILNKNKRNRQSFWALQDFNLDIMAGERVGIIGRNGAGKSTLLKLISRITPPTTGYATLRGRVGSLLEVGTGFHHELSGRENIYLNGSILGLKKAEIDQQFDAIVDFSGVERFIDTPLKHYSNGMQLRLAFSVAAHLEPEILLIDEVLAVGDLEFQKKCLGKMEAISKKEGRTILFVSHNMDSIRKFCTHTILLDEGKLVGQGNTEAMISEYVSKHRDTSAEKNWKDGFTSPTGEVRLNRAFLHDEQGVVVSRFDTASRIGITMEYEILENDAVFTHGINLYNQEQVHLFSSHDVVTPSRLDKRQPGQYKATAWIPGHLLPEGIFTLGVALFRPNPLEVLIHETDSLSFEVFTDFSKQTARGDYIDTIPGLVRPMLDWKLTNQ
jgi:lipopolysaccharide transport system ATP-binding protein